MPKEQSPNLRLKTAILYGSLLYSFTCWAGLNGPADFSLAQPGCQGPRVSEASLPSLLLLPFAHLGPVEGVSGAWADLGPSQLS